MTFDNTTPYPIAPDPAFSRIRILAQVLMLTAGASVASALGASPANASSDSYVAIAVGDLNDAPPVQTVGGMMIGPDEGQVDQKALTNCVGGGGRQCVVEISVKDACAAVASNDFGEFAAASDPSLKVAQVNASNKLQSRQGAHIVQAYCSDGPAQLPAPDQPAPTAAPKPGPIASINKILSGL
jgi:hypothetical protein